MTYRKIFDPDEIEHFSDTSVDAGGGARQRAGDRADRSVYVYTDDIVLAVNVAIATGRPLLIRGASGSGKSSLAKNVAMKMKWRYYEAVVTSRTQARDLEWSFDAVRRLGDAAVVGGLKEISAYIQPGVLWWAFDAAGARHQAALATRAGQEPEIDAVLDTQPAVVLIDEIDKADPDVPNDLLVPVGSLTFTVAETGENVTSKTNERPLLCITTNEERDLPPAFLRRCVGLQLPDPTVDRLVQIGRAHFGESRSARYKIIANEFERPAPSATPSEPAPSTAEYLDAIQASIELKVEPDDDGETWKKILDTILTKRGSTGTGDANV